MKERRKHSDSTSSPLPVDYTRMVTDVFTANFSETLKSVISEGKLQFLASGEIYTNEIVVHVSLVAEGQLSATTVHASCDFDPKASSPTIEDLLSICVDAVGDLFSALFEAKPDAEGNPGILSPALSALGNAPLQWTEVVVNKRKIHLQVDKSNPTLDQAADEWLAKNDPNFKEREVEALKEAEELFVLSPGKRKGDSGLH